MALNIKDKETHRLAQELARRKGETVTMAVKIALKERLEREKPNPKTGLVEYLDELSKRTAPLMTDLPPSDKIGELLFDMESGLPR